MSEETICIDVTDFRFKLASKVRVFHDAWPNVTNSPQNLVASASRLGLTFIATPTGLQAVRTYDLLHGGTEGSEMYPRRCLPVEGITNVTVNCDDSLLAVVLIRSGCPHALIFNTQHFLTEQDVVPQGQMALESQPGASVAQVAWNPAVPGLLCVCLTNGKITTFEFKGPGNVTLINSLPTANATCVAWSPRGKQLVTGNRDGSLSQFMPDLKPVKSLPLPVSLTQPAETIAIAWLSSYQFAVVYKLGVSDDNRLSLCVVNAPKQGPVTCLDFDDICYSSGDLRPHQFYLLHQLSWDIVLCVSANGMEVGVLGQKVPVQPVTGWQQWTMEDSARAELPLEGTTETFPLGVAFDLSSTDQLPWEESLLAPMPILFMLSNRGMLCAFHVMYMRPQAPTLCSAPTSVPNAQPTLFTTPESAQKQQQQQVLPQHETPPPPHTQQQQQQLQQEQNPISFQTPRVTQPASFAPAVSQPISFKYSSPAGEVPAKPVPIQPRINPVPVKAPEVVETPNPTQPEEDLSNEAFSTTAANVLKHFNEEIQSSLKHSHNINVNEVGSPDERANLHHDVSGVHERVQALRSMTKDALETLSEIKNLHVENTRLSEDARTRVNQLKLPGYAQLVRNRPLDQSTASVMQNIENFTSYVNTQLDQAAAGVDQALCQSNNRHNRYGLTSTMALHRTLLHITRCLNNFEGKVANLSARAATEGVTTTTHQSSILDMSSLRDALNSPPASTPMPQPSLRPLSQQFEQNFSRFLKDKPIALAERKPIPSLPPQYAFTSSTNKTPNSTIYQPKTSPISPVVQTSQAFQPTKEATPSFVAQSTSFAFKLPPTTSTLPSSFVQMTPATTANQFAAPPPKASFITVSAPPAHGTPIVVTLFGTSQATSTSSVTTPSFFGTQQNTGFNFGFAAQSAPSLNFSSTTKATPSIFSQPLTGSEKPSSSIFSSEKALFGSAPEQQQSTFPKTDSTSLFGAIPERQKSPVTSFFGTPATSSDKAQSESTFFSQVPPNTPTEIIDTTKSEPQKSFFGNLETAQKPIMSFSTTPPTSLFGGQLTSTPTKVTTGKPSTPIFGQASSETSNITPQSTPSSILESQPSKPLNLSTTEIQKPAVKVTPEVVKPAEDSSTEDKISSSVVSSTDKPEEIKPSTTVETPIKTSETISTSLFGQNIFGQTAPTISTPSLFGSAAKTEVTTPTNVFGQTPQSAATVFGGNTGTTSIFGQPTSTPSVFGGGAVTASVFGQTAPTTASSVFGVPTVTPSPPLFGQTGNFGGQTTTTSVFGGNAATSPSVFGGSIPTSSTSSVFGTSSAFGQPTNAFGETPVTTSTPSAFGTNVFGQVATSPDSSSQVTSLFGGMMGSSGGSLFGSSNFAAKSPATIFGGQSPNAADKSGNLFGSSEACSPFETKSSASKNLFGGGGGTPAASNPFSLTPGSKPSTSSIFGQSPSSPSTFGSSGGSIFGQTSSGPFSAGVAAGSVPFQASSVFGSPANSPSSGSNIFGGSSFSSPTSRGGFGAPPTFGGAPAFGSVFGSTSPTPSFGATEQQTSAFPQANTFTALASQNTVTFGNLAQQAPTAAPPPFGAFGAPQQQQQQQSNNNAPAPQSSSFGGTSFSSWR